MYVVVSHAHAVCMGMDSRAAGACVCTCMGRRHGMCMRMHPHGPQVSDHLLTYSLTHLLTHSLSHSLTHSVTHSLTHLWATGERPARSRGLRPIRLPMGMLPCERQVRK